MNIHGWIGHQVNRWAHARLHRSIHKAAKLAARFDRQMKRMNLPRQQRKRYWSDFQGIVKTFSGGE